MNSLTAPTHTVRGRPARLEGLTNRRTLVVYTDADYPRNDILTERQAAELARPIKEADRE